MRWNPFLGACLLTSALLIPHAGTAPVIAGLVLAGFIHWIWLRIDRIGQRRR